MSVGSLSPTVTHTCVGVLQSLQCCSASLIPRQGRNFTRKIVGGVVLDRDQIAKLKITNFFYLVCLLVIHENLCSQKFPAIRYIYWKRCTRWMRLETRLVFASFMHIQKCLTIICTYAQKARNPLRVIHPSALVSTVRLMSWSSQG